MLVTYLVRCNIVKLNDETNPLESEVSILITS